MIDMDDKTLLLVTRINNIGVYQERDSGYYVSYTPEERQLYRDRDKERIIKMCKESKGFMEDNKKSLCIRFIDKARGSNYNCQFRVPMEMTVEELHQYLVEGINLLNIAYKELAGDLNVRNGEENPRYGVALAIAKRVNRDIDMLESYFEYMREVYKIEVEEMPKPVFMVEV